MMGTQKLDLINVRLNSKIVHSFGQLANMMWCQSYEYNCGMLYEHKRIGLFSSWVQSINSGGKHLYEEETQK